LLSGEGTMFKCALDLDTKSVISVMLGLGLGLRPQNVGLGLEGCGLGLDYMLVIVKLLRTVAHVMAVK